MSSPDRWSLGLMGVALSIDESGLRARDAPPRPKEAIRHLYWVGPFNRVGKRSFVPRLYWTAGAWIM
ncbi:MAG TPA: hypothetical protein VNP98_16650 [Chthoniobacterales bacterium]|nr:hypothetical protein [Chthoniobacterales bacterium]